ncbi:MAG: immunoglobulin domain-containing protein, partial [Verrucomicrobiales bacterium]|nr:immunoglobulin domain-containing protein [Verrucomicrobiales bacterium]
MKIPVVFSAFLAAVLLSPGAVLKSVAAPPVIDAHPESTTNLVGESVVFVVVASSPDGNDLSYQWRRGGTALSDGGRISGARSEVLQIDNLATTDTGNYSVVVTDTVTRQSVTSANAFLRVLEPPRITGQPANQVVVVGRTATFTVRASGTPPLRYQWLADGVPIAGATNATLTLTNVQPDQEGDYVVVVENEALAYGADAAASEPATLTVLIPPRITNHPDSIVAVQGDDVLFSVEAEGTDTEAHPLRYQWRFKGRDLIGETDALLEVLDVQPSDAGEYSVRVYNDAGSVISSNAILTVLTPPVFTLHPAGRTVTAGTRVTFTAMATGTPPVAYQWLFNGDPIPGATNATYSFLATSTAQAGLYSVVASNVVDDVESRAAGLVVVAETVRPTVSITAPPDGFRTTNALVTIHGRAQDNAEVAFVEYQVNGGPFLRASTTNRWTNWTATFVAVAGSNVVRAVAEDTSHNRSVPTPPRRITHVVLWPLTLLIQGNGRVTGATNGQRLEIGRTHTIRAMPALRHLFTEWSGGLQSTNPTLVFEMRTNLLLRASFVTNPFVGLKGTYQGLFAETNAVRNHDRSGSFTLTVAEAGTFSANFQIGTRRLAAAGRFDWLGRAWLTLNVSPGNLLAARLQLDVTNYSAWVEGTLSNQFWQARLLGYRPAPAGAPSPPWAGRHTAVLLHTTNSPLVPGGEGPLTLTL